MIYIESIAAVANPQMEKCANHKPSFVTNRYISSFSMTFSIQDHHYLTQALELANYAERKEKYPLVLF